MVYNSDSFCLCEDSTKRITIGSTTKASMYASREKFRLPIGRDHRNSGTCFLPWSAIKTYVKLAVFAYPFACFYSAHLGKMPNF